MKSKSAERAPQWLRRAGHALLIAGVLCATAMGYRTVQIQRAAQQQNRMNLVQVPVDDLDGGFVIRPVRKGFRLGRPGLTSRLLADGESFEIDRTEFVFHEARRGKHQVEVMSVPLRVFAARETDQGPRGGFKRIDIGGDPAGAATGTMDRIYVDHRVVLEQLKPSARPAFERTRGVAHLVPSGGDVFRLQQRSMRAAAEVPGVSRWRGDEELELAVGGPSAELLSGDRLTGPGFDLQITIEERWSSVPLADGTGKVVAQRQVLEPQFTVTTPQENDDSEGGQAYLSFVDRGGEDATVRLSTTRPNMLFGGGDRMRPLQGRVIPESVEHRELQERFLEGVERGVITLRRGFLVVESADGDPTGFTEEVGPTITSQLARLARQYNRGQVPGTITVMERGEGLGLENAGVWSLRVGDDEVPPTGVHLDEGGLVLPPPGEFDPARLAPGETMEWSAVRTLSVAEASAGVLGVDSALPVTVWMDGRELAHVRGTAVTVDLALEPGIHLLELRARYTGRPSGYGQLAGVRADIAGAEPVEALAGRRRYMDWTEVFDGGRTWSPAREGEGGRLWVQTAAPQDKGLTGYLQMRFDAPAAGPDSLEISLDGILEEAYLNGVALPASSLPYLPGESARLPVTVRRGSNLLALRVRQPTATPDQAMGGVRLEFDGGALAGLHPQTERRARRASRAPWKREPALATRASVPLRMTVVREVPGLAEGSEWLVGSGGDEESMLILPGEEMATTTVFELEPDLTVRYRPGSEAPFQVVNRTQQRVALFRQEDPMRRPYQPFGGYAIYAGRAEPLKHDRDAVRGRSAQVTYRTGATTLLGAVHVLRDGELHRLVVDGGGKLVPEGVTSEHLHLRRQGDRLELLGAAEGTAIYREGAVRVTVAGPEDLPVEILDCDALSCPGGLLLVASADAVHPQDGGPLATSLEPVREASLALSSGRARGESPHVALTIDPVLQAAAVDEMNAQLELVEHILADAGLDYEPGPADLRGALLILDAVTGEILTALSEEATGPGAAGAWGMAWTHPGSTFKIVTALAALSSQDPEVQAMLEGELPAGLSKASSGTLRGAEISRLTPGGGRWASDGTDAIRLRSNLRNFRGAPLPAGTDLTRGLGGSSNLYFGYLTLLMYKPLRESWVNTGIASSELRDELVPLAGLAHRLGFGSVIDLVPSSVDARKKRQAPLTDAGGRPVAPGDALYGWTGSFPEGLLTDPEMAACGVGQGEVYATPLQMARVAAVVANDGKLVHPTLIAAVDGKELAPDPATEVALPEGAPGRVRKGMRQVVAAGTASTPMSDNPYRGRVFGKTGSSERPGSHGALVTDSWFVGVLEPEHEDAGSPDPAHHPQVVVCVMPSAGLGGTHAADVADRMIRHMARRHGQSMDAD